jgi:hypothetical protein
MQWASEGDSAPGFYNSSYVYYSVDFCEPGGAMQPNPRDPRPQISTAGILGAVLGGLLGLVVGFVAFFLVRRKKRGSKNSAAVAAEEKDIVEEHKSEVYQPYELSTGVTTYEEIETAKPPVELAGKEMRGDYANI